MDERCNKPAIQFSSVAPDRSALRCRIGAFPQETRCDSFQFFQFHVQASAFNTLIINDPGHHTTWQDSVGQKRFVRKTCAQLLEVRLATGPWLFCGSKPLPNAQSLGQVLTFTQQLNEAAISFSVDRQELGAIPSPLHCIEAAFGQSDGFPVRSLRFVCSAATLEQLTQNLVEVNPILRVKDLFGSGTDLFQSLQRSF